MTHIKDDIEEVVRLMREGYTFDDSFDIYSTGEFPYFMYGHAAEINQRLMDKDKGKTSKNQKYPLIALRADIEQDKDGGVINYSLNIGIFTYTKEHLNAEQRTDQVFKLILIPLYDAFMITLRKSGLFIWPGHYIPKHRYVERPFYGTQDEQKNVKRIFNDPIDGIELLGLELKKRNC